MIEATYIESGTFVAGEEDVYNAGIEFNEDVIILTKKEHSNLLLEQKLWWDWWNTVGFNWYTSGKFPQNEKPPFLKQK